MKRIKIYGGFKSGKTRQLVDYLISYIVNGKKCLYVSLGDFSEYDLYKFIESLLPNEVDFKDVSNKVDYLIGGVDGIGINDLVTALKDRIDYDAIFIDPINGLYDYYDYGIKKVEIYNKLRELSDLLDADLYVSLCKGPDNPDSEGIGITDF